MLATDCWFRSSRRTKAQSKVDGRSFSHGRRGGAARRHRVCEDWAAGRSRRRMFVCFVRRPVSLYIWETVSLRAAPATEAARASDLKVLRRFQSSSSLFAARILSATTTKTSQHKHIRHTPRHNTTLSARLTTTDKPIVCSASRSAANAADVRRKKTHRLVCANARISPFASPPFQETDPCVKLSPPPGVAVVLLDAGGGSPGGKEQMRTMGERSLFLGASAPRSSEQWQAPSTWDAISFDSEERRGRCVCPACSEGGETNVCVRACVRARRGAAGTPTPTTLPLSSAKNTKTHNSTPQP